MWNWAAHAKRLFNPAEAEFSSLSAVSAALELLGGLCPEATRRLYGDDGMTPIELFCEGRPAPAAVRLQATEMQGRAAPLLPAFVTAAENQP